MRRVEFSLCLRMLRDSGHIQLNKPVEECIKEIETIILFDEDKNRLRVDKK